MRSLQTLLALFACAALPLHAAGLADLTWTTTGGEVTITDCDEAASGALVIPDTIEDHPVTSIGESAFRDCRSLTSITIPDSVTSIGARGLSWCYRLTSITIPDSVTSIGEEAFRLCYRLTSITIGDSVTSIGEGAFYECNSLASITFLGTAPTVGADAFFDVPVSARAWVTIEALSSFGGLGADWNSLTVSMSNSALSDLTAQFAELSQRPTQVAYNAAVATARTAGRGDVTSDPASYSLFTEDQIHAMSADYTMGLNEAGNVEIKIFFIESADLQAFTPFTVNPESVSVVDGKICLEFPSEDRAFFFRFRVE